MTTYQQSVENYGDQGLISTEVVTFDLTGEDEQKYLSPDRLQQAYSTLRTWAADAQSSYTTWPSKTAAEKDAAVRITLQRLGILADRLADVLLVEGLR